MNTSRIRNFLNYAQNGEGLYMLLARAGKKNNDSNETYIRHVYKASFGHEPDLENPVTFNEKLQWLKLHDHRPAYPTMVDKRDMKDYVSSLIGEGHTIPSLGVWDDFDSIDFSALPDRFVLKCTHDSGGLVICKDKASLDMDKARKKITACLKRNFYWVGREWPYQQVKPRIIAEPYMQDSPDIPELSDYKIHCFSGEPHFVQVITDRFSPSGMINDHYSPDWVRQDIVRGHYHTAPRSLERPAQLDEMLGYARILSAGLPYIRTDFYISDGKVYVGELTLYPASGFNPFHPDKWDRIWGDLVKLSS